jgi:hypothetical protein
MLADVLYQAVFHVVMFQCAIAIARYLPYSPPPVVNGLADNSGGATNGTNGKNRTIERMCKWGAPEEDVDGPFAVCLQVLALLKFQRN